MMQQLVKSNITLKGSAKIITEFFDYSLNNILYQRGIYPSDVFRMTKKYGLSMLVTTDPELQDYIKKILTQVEKWIVFKNITHLVLAISSKETREVLERWQFDISLEDDQVDSSDSTPIQHTTEEQIQKDIQALIRQITASVTFLPSLEEKCTFNILIYTDMGAEVPSDWINTDPHPVKNFEQVKFRSFSTTVHKVDSFVSYRRDSDVC